MRGRILIPILVLLALFCAVLGVSVYSNVSNATSELINKQLDSTLVIVEKEIVKIQESNAERPDAPGNSESTSSTSNLQKSYQDIVDGLGVADGGVLIIDESGVVVADSRGVMSDKKVADQDWYQEATQTTNSEFTTVFGQTEVYAHALQLDEALAVSYLSNEAVTELFVTPLYVIGVVGLVSVVVVGILIYFLITRLVINPLESLDEQVKDLDNVHEIDLEPLKYCPEIAAPAEQLNILLKQQQERGPSAVVPLEGAEPPEELPEELPPAEAGGATTFELITLLRETFEHYRQTVADKQLKFSLLVDNDTPEIIFANRDLLFTSMERVLSEALAEAVVGTEVSAKVSFLEPEPKISRNEPAILFKVHYNGLETSTLLEAKRG